MSGKTLTTAMRTVCAGAALAVGTLLVSGAAPALAATVVGQVNAPYKYAQCGSAVLVNTAVPAGTNPYAVPAPGVITSWSTATATEAGTAKLKVLRPTGQAGQYLVVGEDGPRAVAAGTSPSFSDVHIPVRAGDLIGLLPTGTNCMAWFQASLYSYTVLTPGTDPAPGSVASVFSTAAQFAIVVSATVEPDADGDGFGDETQDACPADVADHTLPCGEAAASGGGSAGSPSGDPAPTGAPAGDGTAPRLRLSGPAKQAPLRAGAVLEVATVDEAARLRATGSLRIAGTRAALPLRPAGAGGAAGIGTLLRLRLPARTERRLRSALRHHRRVRALVTVTAADAASNSTRATQVVAIRGGHRRS